MLGAGVGQRADGDGKDINRARAMDSLLGRVICNSWAAPSVQGELQMMTGDTFFPLLPEMPLVLC